MICLYLHICINNNIIIAACGNYMNGGNRQRGQADGFMIDILPKVKDVKSKDNSINLLAYIVRFCVEKFDEKKGTPEAALPVPEPSDLEKCQHIDFDSQRADCERVTRELDKVKAKTKKVFENSPEDLQEPFNRCMTEFIDGAEVQVKELKDLVEECAVKFYDCKKFYNFTPKKGKLENATPEEFFSIFYPFCLDYKNLWKKEQVRIQKDMLKKERLLMQKKKESLKNVDIKKTPATGLKAKLLERRKTKTSTGSPSLEVISDSRADGDSQQQEKESLKTKMLKRKGKKDDPKSGQESEEPEHSDCVSEAASETPKASGLKAKLMQRRARQEAAREQSEEQDEY